ncbi:succinate--CoA ligase subunit beta [Phormidesmis priestleyi]|uniref:succinate--CoA ligase subunit beta n=1 Tax=Phormidesmis priestleyi TaxID=268141 RepID=UPI00083AAC90|nr:succinate--CoA ligase subunit beta [Phormidesmis priestleyi]
MDLLEYQAKELFREMGIPVLPSQRIDRPRDLKGLELPYPIVLKSQVYMGGRGRVGGVRFAENTIDAVAAAQTIFNLPIMGEYPKVLLAEAKYDVQQELYLAVALNRSIRRPVLLGSLKGGIDVRAAIDEMKYVVVDQEFSPFFARRLMLKMGLQGALINSVSAIVEKMYRLFLDNDLDLVEINPLGVSPTGEVMALDGKVTVNDDALARHPALAALNPKAPADPLHALDKLTPQTARSPEVVSTLNSDGQIGILCNGAGLTMATMDLVCQSGGKPANFLDIGSETHYSCMPDILGERLENGLEAIAQNKQVRVVLINLVSGTVSCEQIADAIVRFLQHQSRKVRSISEAREDGLVSRVARNPQLVVRLVGSHLAEAKERLSTTQALIIDDLEIAVSQAVSFTKQTKKPT